MGIHSSLNAGRNGQSHQEQGGQASSAGRWTSSTGRSGACSPYELILYPSAPQAVNEGSCIERHFLSCAVNTQGVLVHGLCSQFGPKVVPPKRIVKMLQDLLNHTDNNVRRLAKDLTVELCRWIGKDALKRSLFDNLKKQAVRAAHMAGTSIGPAGL